MLLVTGSVKSAELFLSNNHFPKSVRQIWYPCLVWSISCHWSCSAAIKPEVTFTIRKTGWRKSLKTITKTVQLGGDVIPTYVRAGKPSGRQKNTGWPAPIPTREFWRVITLKHFPYFYVMFRNNSFFLFLSWLAHFSISTLLFRSASTWFRVKR